MVRPSVKQPPPPMPKVRRARIFLDDMRVAVNRADAAWNVEQMIDALDSLERFIKLARKAIGHEIHS